MEGDQERSHSGDCGRSRVLGPVALGTNKAWDFYITETPACELSWALPLAASFPRSLGCPAVMAGGRVDAA